MGGQNSVGGNMIRQQERLSGRAVPYGVLLTRTNPTIRTRTTAHILRSMSEAAVPMFNTELHEREAFRAMFSFRRTLEELQPSEVANLDKAQANAEAYAREVVATLRQRRSGKTERAGETQQP